MSKKILRSLLSAFSRSETNEIKDNLLLARQSERNVSSHWINNEELAKYVFNALEGKVNPLVLIYSKGNCGEAVCEWMYEWYTKNLPDARRVIIEFIPALVNVYLHHNFGPLQIAGESSASPSRASLQQAIETCLIGIYTVEQQSRGEKELTWKPPSISRPNVYRNNLKDTKGVKERKSTLSSPFQSALTEKSLKQLNQSSSKVEGEIREFKLPSLEKMRQEERDLIVRVALQQFHANLHLVEKISMEYYCEMVLRISTSGFPFHVEFSPSRQLGDSFEYRFGHEERKENGKEEMNGKGDYDSESDSEDVEVFSSLVNASKQRLNIPTSILSEFVTGLTFAVFNNSVGQLAEKAVGSLRMRASYEMNAPLLLATSALVHLDEEKKRNEQKLRRTQSKISVATATDEE